MSIFDFRFFFVCVGMMLNASMRLSIRTAQTLQWILELWAHTEYAYPNIPRRYAHIIHTTYQVRAFFSSLTACQWGGVHCTYIPLPIAREPAQYCTHRSK
jgi:hypothetical protein